METEPSDPRHFPPDRNSFLSRNRHTFLDVGFSRPFNSVTFSLDLCCMKATDSVWLITLHIQTFFLHACYSILVHMDFLQTVIFLDFFFMKLQSRYIFQETYQTYFSVIGMIQILEFLTASGSLYRCLITYFFEDRPLLSLYNGTRKDSPLHS